MRSRLNWVLLCAAGLSSGWGCSDDGGGAASTRFETLPNQGGSAGSGSSQTGSSGTGASTGGSSSEGGNVPPGLSGTGAASGEGRTADAGSASATADAGPVDAGAAPAEDPPAEPDAEAPPVTPEPVPPAQDDVTFGDVFPLLVASCGGCHGANAPGNRPRFAQAGNQAASFTATQAMSTGQGAGSIVSARIITRALVNRNMPPACGGNALGTGACLDVAEGALLQAWLDQGAQQ